MLKYKEEQIQNIRNLLDNLAVKGVENAKRVAIISQILEEGIVESSIKEVACNDNSKKQRTADTERRI